MDEAVDHEKRECAYRHVDVKSPTPAVGVSQPAAQGRPDDRGDHDAESEQCHGRSALRGWEAFKQNGLRKRLQRAPARALDNTGNQDEDERRSRAHEHRCDRKDHHADQQEPLAPEPERKPVARRENGCVCDQVAGQNPGGLIIGSGKRPGDVGQRHGGNRRIEHLHKGGEHDGDGDQPWIDTLGGVILIGGVRHRQLSRERSASCVWDVRSKAFVRPGF